MNIFKQLIKSIYSPSDIATFINQRKRKSFLFVFILALIALLPGTYFIGETIIDTKNEINEVIENELPAFTIEDNHLVSNELAPVILNGKTVTYLFDSTNTLTANDVTDTSTIGFLYDGIYFAGEKIPYTYLGINTNEDLSLLLEPVINNNTLIYSILIVIYIFSAIWLFFILLIELVLISLIGKLMAGKNYTFGQIYRIAPYTMTLSTLFFFIMDWLQIIVPFASFTSLLVTLIILYLTIVELKKTDNKEQLV